ncbi:MAG TPA: hypothetical protein VM165_13105 [Planctomycetaceae bacterium]|nr:hypothetical protein [Planctomycetaceae bacterium]
MRTWFTLLALTGFLPQQFTCCAQSCGPCAESVDAHEAESPCEHHGDHDHDFPVPSHDAPHHLCVATHLFYLTRSDTGSLLPDLSLNYVAVPALDAVLDQPLHSPSAVRASLSVRPSAAQRLRAVLNVWIV